VPNVFLLLYSSGSLTLLRYISKVVTPGKLGIERSNTVGRWVGVLTGVELDWNTELIYTPAVFSCRRLFGGPFDAFRLQTTFSRNGFC